MQIRIDAWAVPGDLQEEKLNRGSSCGRSLSPARRRHRTRASTRVLEAVRRTTG